MGEVKWKLFQLCSPIWLFYFWYRSYSLCCFHLSTTECGSGSNSKDIDQTTRIRFGPILSRRRGRRRQVPSVSVVSDGAKKTPATTAATIDLSRTRPLHSALQNGTVLRRRVARFDGQRQCRGDPLSRRAGGLDQGWTGDEKNADMWATGATAASCRAPGLLSQINRSSTERFLATHFIN